MKQLIAAALFGLVICTPTVTSQTSGFSQRGKVTHDLKDEGFSIAHSSLPLNSKAKIVNTSTGKEVEVTVTRLIPASADRIADISPSVWQELGLTPNTDTRIYTNASGKKQIAALPAAKPQESAEKIAQAETNPGGNRQPSDESGYINYDNAQARPPAVAYETRPQQNQPPMPYYDPRQQQAPPAPYYYDPRQQQSQAPMPYYDPRSQQAQPAPYYDPRQQQAPPAPYYYDPRQQQSQPAMVSDTWAQVAKPAAETRQQQSQPAIAYSRPQQAQPAAAYETWTQAVGGIPYQSAPFMETHRQQAQAAMVSDIRAQAARPAAAVETRTNAGQSGMVSETRTPASWTLVIIDAPPKTPRPSVVIDNGPQ